ncbi:MAG: helix-turn-helix domain-containing protein [Alphaproteobacteria bacterium]
MSISEIDLALRAANVALMLLGIIILLRDAGSTHIGRLGALFLFGAIAYVISSTPHFLGRSAWVVLPTLAISIPNMVFFWMFGRALFDDDYRVGWLEPLICVVLVGLGFARLFTWGWMPAIPHELMRYVPQALKLAMVCHVVWLALRGREEDLIEERRRFRLLFITVIALFAGIVLVVEATLPIGGPAPWVHILNMSALLAISLFVVLRLTHLRHDHLVGALIPESATPAPAPRRDPRDQKIMENLDAAMVVDKLYLREDLTIGALADHLSVQEHVLRRIINKELEYRNFSQFLSQFRLADAQAALADPDKAHLPILSIALRVGYGSIGPFNRAFKDKTGLTPSQFRKKTHSS